MRQVATNIDDKIRMSKSRKANISEKDKMNITEKEIQITLKLVERIL